MSQTDGLFFKDPKGNYNVVIYQESLNELAKICTTSHATETGGILIGYYNERLDTANISKVFNAPPDSRFGNTWFHRGISGLQSLIHEYWNNKTQYYLGEWHYHPLSEPEPSDTDKEQMVEISLSIPYRCPEPVLFIVGGGPNIGWKYQVVVFPKREGKPVLLSLS